MKKNVRTQRLILVVILIFVFLVAKPQRGRFLMIVDWRAREGLNISIFREDRMDVESRETPAPCKREAGPGGG